MKVKNSYDCEKCLNKEVCKYYDECKTYSNKDVLVKPKNKKEQESENLTLTITCKYYRTETNTLTYPEGCRGNIWGGNGTGGTGGPSDLGPYITLCNNDSDNSHVSTKVTNEKHI